MPEPLSESRLRELLVAGARRFRVPGAQLGVLRGSERYVVCCGSRREGADLPVTASTRFHAGSIAKALTGQLVLESAARGELDLDVACSDQADLDWDDTPRALLSQTSGRPNELPGPDETLVDFCARVAAMGRVHDPGRFSYSNAGWSALDLLLTRRSGRGFAERVVEQFGGHLGVPPDPAEGHAVSADGTLEATPPTFSPAAAAAGACWWASADELLDLAEHHLRPGDADDAGLLAAMREPVAPLPGATVGDAWGLGWMVWEQPRAFGWAGFTGGHRAYLRCFPDHDAALVLTASSAGPLFGPPGGSALFDDLLGDLLDLLAIVTPSAPTDAGPTLDHAALPGQYGPLAVTAAGSDLRLDGRMLGGREDHLLTRAYADTWVVDGAPPGSIPLAFAGPGGASSPDLLYLGPFAMPRLG